MVPFDEEVVPRYESGRVTLLLDFARRRELVEQSRKKWYEKLDLKCNALISYKLIPYSTRLLKDHVCPSTYFNSSTHIPNAAAMDVHSAEIPGPGQSTCVGHLLDVPW